MRLLPRMIESQKCEGRANMINKHRQRAVWRTAALSGLSQPTEDANHDSKNDPADRCCPLFSEAD